MNTNLRHFTCQKQEDTEDPVSRHRLWVLVTPCHYDKNLVIPFPSIVSILEEDLHLFVAKNVALMFYCLNR